MNESFHELSKEKRLTIIDAGFEVFAKYDYKHARTDEIAMKAGISKGLLFYYFHNKKELYLYLIEYAKDVMMYLVEKHQVLKGNDLFEMLNQSMYLKLELMKKNPHLYAFFIKAYANETGDAQHTMKEYLDHYMKNNVQDLLKDIDFSPFREDVDPMKVWNLIYYFSLGYIEGKIRTEENLNLDLICEEIESYLIMLKKHFYKEDAYVSNRNS